MSPPPITLNPLLNTHALTYSCLMPHILELLDKGLSGYAIAKTTSISVGSISNLHSKHCSSLSKSLGGHPQKLSLADTQYAVCLITS